MAAAAAFGLRPGAALAESAPPIPRYELWIGAQAYQDVWSLYSGVTAAPFGSVREDGLRLRAAGGTGGYTYERAGVGYRGTVSFADILLGYHAQLGPVTVKVYAGATGEDRRIAPFDPDVQDVGTAFGAKVVLESWWTVSDKAWASLDLNAATLRDAYAARLRLGWRILSALSVGLEAGAFGSADCDVGRIGGFVRYEWATGEVSLSAGFSHDKLDLADPFNATSNSPFATVTWLTRF